jgi:phage-related protein
VEKIRELVFYRHYFDEFYASQNQKVKVKVDHVFFVLTHALRIPEKFLKHIEGHKSIYEIRVEAGSNIFRIFCCFDKGNIVVLFNAFQKKTQKTPKGEIEFALKLMAEYFDDK